jgi:hypothetical protein
MENITLIENIGIDFSYKYEFDIVCEYIGNKIVM